MYQGTASKFLVAFWTAQFFHLAYSSTKSFIVLLRRCQYSCAVLGYPLDVALYQVALGPVLLLVAEQSSTALAAIYAYCLIRVNYRTRLWPGKEDGCWSRVKVATRRGKHRGGATNTTYATDGDKQWLGWNERRCWLRAQQSYEHSNKVAPHVGRRKRTPNTVQCVSSKVAEVTKSIDARCRFQVCEGSRVRGCEIARCYGAKQVTRRATSS